MLMVLFTTINGAGTGFPDVAVVKNMCSNHKCGCGDHKHKGGVREYDKLVSSKKNHSQSEIQNGQIAGVLFITAS